MHKIEYYLVYGLFRLFRNISFKTGKKIASLLYFLVAVLFRYRKKVILENLHRVYGTRLPDDERTLLRSIYKNFIYLWMEFLQSGKMIEDAVDKHFTFYNIEILNEGIESGKGVLLLSSHFGNFEWLAQVLPKMGYSVSGIAKRQSNPYVNAFVEERRTRTGLQIIYTRDAVKQSLKALKRGEIVALVADQDARDRGVFVDFMGLPSSTAVGPAVMHLRSGAPIILIISIRKDYGRFDVYFEEIVPVGQNKEEVTNDEIVHITQMHAAALERWVRKYPEQWFWMHRRWKTKPEEELRIEN
ncbi:MAG TPA: hypothetical protein ENK44_01535 [Caldithrix abyssi]|uniref:Lipid A biosynthesis acyltransferase n=1 Tax=Caldithrix abyssi TaxID=187145 RepID=A0A7V4TY07_CALAY|nr:hypothetical protein [Caldithrix abyssi]